MSRLLDIFYGVSVMVGVIFIVTMGIQSGIDNYSPSSQTINGSTYNKVSEINKISGGIGAGFDKASANPLDFVVSVVSSGFGIFRLFGALYDIVLSIVTGGSALTGIHPVLVAIGLGMFIVTLVIIILAYFLRYGES